MYTNTIVSRFPLFWYEWAQARHERRQALNLFMTCRFTSKQPFSLALDSYTKQQDSLNSCQDERSRGSNTDVSIFVNMSVTQRRQSHDQRTLAHHAHSEFYLPAVTGACKIRALSELRHDNFYPRARNYYVRSSFTGITLIKYVDAKLRQYYGIFQAVTAFARYTDQVVTEQVSLIG